MVTNKLVFSIIIILFLDLLSQWVASIEQHGNNNLRTYIVHVQKPEKNALFTTMQSSKDNLHHWYQSFLPPTTRTRTHSSGYYQPRMVHSYQHVGHAFAAKLTPEEAHYVKNRDGVVMVREEKMLKLHTTRSPTFLGLQPEAGLWKESNFGKGVIIGVFDCGIWPHHPSFSDEGMPPPPAKWKGKCEFGGNNINKGGCNNKLIGAMNMIGSSTMPPYDDVGHGTHTAGTAAGNFVKDANVFGHAYGTAVGMAPLAHLAIYKVCNQIGCPESSVLAAFDAAIEDGVDIISISLGADLGAEPLPFYLDSMSLGSFAALQKGILVTASAGNEGPGPSTLSNEAPWMLCVGASSLDRRIVASAKLGNGTELEGESLFPPQFMKDFNSSSNNSLLPVVHFDGNFCFPDVLRITDVSGKIVLCVAGSPIANFEQAHAVKMAGGVAMILANNEAFGYTTLADKYTLPATQVSYAAGLEIMSYIDSTNEPEATILFKGTEIGNNSSAPTVPFFSSRGPSKLSPGVLKPDIIGPGVSILAAWIQNFQGGEANFDMLSGTSMSCPHISGIAAMIKSSHPDWSPAAIKSAMMTTAYTTNLEGKPIEDEKLQPANLFATGSGHVNVSRVNDPGLVYDMEPNDYTGYLCGLGFTNTQVGIIMHRTVNCASEMKIEGTQLNYPSFSVLLGPNNPQTYTRTVTNVGPAGSNYTVKVVPPGGVRVTVKPQTLVFNRVQQKANYSVTFSRIVGGGTPIASPAEGVLEWLSDKHSVRSPISVTAYDRE